jgi:hypothetical protein
MIIALAAKDLNLVARDRVFHFALIGFLVIYLSASLFFLSSFLTATHNPFAAMSSLLFFRVSIFQGVILAAFIPWVILRMHEQDLSCEPRPLGAGMIAMPWQIILSKLIASSLCLLNLVALALPVLCLARLLGAATFQQIGWVLFDTFLFLMVTAVIVFHLRLRFRGWLSCWILSYASLAIAGFAWYKAWVFVGRDLCSLLFFLLLVLFTALLFPHGSRALMYERN